MNRRTWIATGPLLLALLSCPWPALAHDPGLSRAVLQIGPHRLVMRITFAERELEVVVPMDRDDSGDVSGAEFSHARDRLLATIAAGIDLRVAHQRIAPELRSVEQAPSHTLTAELRFQRPFASNVELTVPLIAQLARGHRQYLAVHDERGQLLGQYILDSQTGPLALPQRQAGWIQVFDVYLIEGIWHIWIGFDHILFLLTLMLPTVLAYRGGHWRAIEKLTPALIDILKIVTAFTVAHSITLALGALDLVWLPDRLVESAIAFSVLVTAINNLRPMGARSRWLLAFIFGLVHGLGFANVLLELGLPRDHLALSLLGFNLGVELGQLAIVFVLFSIAVSIRRTDMYRTWVFSGGSLAAAVVAGVWMFERIFDYEVLGF